MMSDGIPFVASKRQLALAVDHFSDAPLIRVPLDRMQTDREDQLDPAATGFRIWIDPVVDGLHSLREVAQRKGDPFSRKRDDGEQGQYMWEPYAQWLAKFSQHDNLLLEKPAPALVQPFVDEILDACMDYAPDWISVPQLPLCPGSSRNKVNTRLSECTNDWRQSCSFGGKLVSPVILSRFKDVYDKKTVRNAKIAEIEKCIERSGAEAAWVVDADLDDQKGSAGYQSRFAQLVNLHKEIQERFGRSLQIVAGPYWGMNLVLWARDLCDEAAISMGVGYQYRVSGLTGFRPKTRIALPPVRRCAAARPGEAAPHGLKRWLETAAENTDLPTRVRHEFSRLAETYEALITSETRARKAVVKFWKSWFDRIRAHSQRERSLALFQDLTEAYAIGTMLDELPKSEAPGRRPERVAQQLMLNCL
jgi:hypothetical protein